MADEAERRPGESCVTVPTRVDATLVFIGLIHTPWSTRQECPRRGDLDGPECRIDVDPHWAEALEGVEAGDALQVLYWLHLARRDLVRQWPRGRASPIGTFALRSPMRPNPIASSVVRVTGRSASALRVRGLDCVDGTPLIDLKPDRCPVSAMR